MEGGATGERDIAGSWTSGEELGFYFQCNGKLSFQTISLKYGLHIMKCIYFNCVF